MGNLAIDDSHQWTEEDYQVSNTMQTYFANFIKHGDPNGEGVPTWPASEATSISPKIMNINTVSKAENAKNDDRYRFLDAQYGNKK